MNQLSEWLKVWLGGLQSMSDFCNQCHNAEKEFGVAVTVKSSSECQIFWQKAQIQVINVGN